MIRLLLLLGLLLGAAPAQTDVERAEYSYRAGLYEEALRHYEAALRGGEFAAGPLLFDLGNCAYRLGDHANAALYYRRALLRLPDLERARFNLHLAQEQLGVTAAIAGPRGVLAWLDAAPPAALLSLIAAMQSAGLLGFLLLRRPWLRGAMLLLAALGLAGGVHQGIRLWSAPPTEGVVLVPQLLLHDEPQAEAGGGATLQAGEVVQVLASTDAWLQVQHARGGGWAERRSIGIVD